MLQMLVFGYFCIHELENNSGIVLFYADKDNNTTTAFWHAGSSCFFIHEAVQHGLFIFNGAQ